MSGRLRSHFIGGQDVILEKASSIAVTRDGFKQPQFVIVDISHPVCTNIRRLFSPKQNNFFFDSVDKLSPVSNMAYSCLKKC